jgi:hypothetical protein
MPSNAWQRRAEHGTAAQSNASSGFEIDRMASRFRLKRTAPQFTAGQRIATQGKAIQRVLPLGDRRKGELICSSAQSMARQRKAWH